MRRLARFVALVPLLAGAACGGNEKPLQGVAVSVFPLYDVVRRVAGDRLPVYLVLPPGHDHHSFDPRPQDVAALAQAGLIFGVGLGLDDWVQDLAQRAGTGEATVFEVAPLLDPILMEDGKTVDPHFWLDPVRMQQAVDVIVGALTNLDAEEGPLYRQRGEEVKQSLHELHREIARRSGAWTKRSIVTFHESMRYFADRYKLDVVAVVEPRPGQEPTPKHLAEVVDVLKKTGAALLSEPQLDPRPARVLASEAGVAVFEIDPQGGSPATDSYEKLMRQIADVLDKALE
ncbi:MAG TPA: metal ABC transporter substrate-binding protein [Vicinamibacteria bacterium]|jgi:zinc transport system substrate-binding protein